jgi:hypothetical protein
VITVYGASDDLIESTANRVTASNNATARIRRSRNACTSRRTVRRGLDDRGEVGMILTVLPANTIDRQRLTHKSKDL